MEFRTWQEIEAYYNEHRNDNHDNPDTPDPSDAPDNPPTPDYSNEIREVVAAEMATFRDSLLKEMKAINLKTADVETPNIPDFIDVLRGVIK